CTPCREGTVWVHKILGRIVEGNGRPEDLDLLLSIADNMGGRKTVCALGDFAGFPVVSALKHFRAEFEHHIHHGSCPTGTRSAVAVG
ncbi:MAG TPA: NADH-ubiquinone oxidoreductase-F iron-sulfur binding region domain-containing protein, partial [Chloroflexota bacterium]|nr:NADH-ubiquinone oxidoreductase-F iron-sulfur binding region domain-containing protein [Chloroflexota bacterium]